MFRLLFPLFVCLAQAAGVAAEEDGRQQDERYGCSFEERCWQCFSSSSSLVAAVETCQTEPAGMQPRCRGNGQICCLIAACLLVCVFLLFAVPISGPPGGPLLLQQTPDTSSSEVSFAQEEVGLLGVKRLPLTGSVITSHRLPLRFVRCFSFIARGKHRGVGFA